MDIPTANRKRPSPSQDGGHFCSSIILSLRPTRLLIYVAVLIGYCRRQLTHLGAATQKAPQLAPVEGAAPRPTNGGDAIFSERPLTTQVRKIMRRHPPPQLSTNKRRRHGRVVNSVSDLFTTVALLLRPIELERRSASHN